MANLHVTAQLLFVLKLPGRHQVTQCNMVKEHTACAWCSLHMSDLHRSTCCIAVHVTVHEQAGTVLAVTGVAPEPQIKRKRFNGIRRALKVRSGSTIHQCAAVWLQQCDSLTSL